MSDHQQTAINQGTEEPLEDTPQSLPKEVPEGMPPSTAAGAHSEDIRRANMNARFEELNCKLTLLSTGLKEVILGVRLLQKEVNRQTRQRGRRGGAAAMFPPEPHNNVVGEAASANTSSLPKQPSGFAKPTRVSDALCEFLDMPHGSLLARTMVTKLLNQYIKDNDLQNKEDKRRIIPNDKLRAILNLGEHDTITYFNLQSHIKHHFERA
jgi:chromatin remodeling complex protein RSC6